MLYIVPSHQDPARQPQLACSTVAQIAFETKVYFFFAVHDLRILKTSFSYA